MQGTNTLAYYKHLKITDVKSLLVSDLLLDVVHAAVTGHLRDGRRVLGVNVITLLQM